MRQCVQSSRPSAQHIAGDHMGLPLPVMPSPSPATWFPCHEAQRAESTTCSFSRAGRATLGSENGQSLGQPPHTCLIYVKSKAGHWEPHHPIILWGDVPAGDGFPGPSAR